MEKGYMNQIIYILEMVVLMSTELELIPVYPLSWKCVQS